MYSNCSPISRNVVSRIRKNFEYIAMLEISLKPRERTEDNELVFCYVWCGMVDRWVLSLYVFEHTSTGNRYLAFPQFDLIAALIALYSNLKEVQQNFQQDSALPHYAGAFRDSRNEMFDYFYWDPIRNTLHKIRCYWQRIKKEFFLSP